ncbi:MAG TPA: hypothetical protein DCX71_02835 [Erythrobacter sp.]|nr:hypothetical protein [Erythrobacter sp.]
MGTTLSGGEAKRVKRFDELSNRRTDQTLYILTRPLCARIARDGFLDVRQSGYRSMNCLLVVHILLATQMSFALS